MIRYVFRHYEPLIIKAAAKANPQKIGEALNKIAMAGGNKITPRATVDAARDQKSPLHPHFEWDDRVAAEAHRLEQARNLISVVRIVDEESEEGNVRAFLSINDGKGRVYHPVDAVKRSAELQAALTAQADRELEAFQRRYRSLKEVCAIIELAREKLRAKTAKDVSAKTRGNGRSKRSTNNEIHAPA